jgi:hypothetical protein
VDAVAICSRSDTDTCGEAPGYGIVDVIPGSRD